VFSTYFYIIILLFQSIYAESNFRYNQEIRTINTYVSESDYITAFASLKKLEQRSIFTNNDLVRMKRNVALKIHAESFDLNVRPRSLNEFIISSLDLYQRKKYAKSLAFCRQIIVNEPIVSDSMIKVFEVLAYQVPNGNNLNELTSQISTIKNIRLNEAMNLLDLMKRKEKTLF
jgi:hypothetical protein